MVIQELALQGLAGFRSPLRLTLKPGFVVFVGQGAAAAPLGEVVTAALYPSDAGDDSALKADPAGPGRIGFSASSDDGETWRLLRDVGKGSVLQQLDRATGKHVVVTQDPADVGVRVRQVFRLPSVDAFRTLFVLRAAQFPSRNPISKPAAPAPRRPTFDYEQANQQVEALRRERDLSQQITELQFQYDGLGQEVFRLEAIRRKGEELLEKMSAQRSAVAQAPTAELLGLPEDIVSRVQRVPMEKKRYQEALDKLERERRSAGVEDEPSSTRPLYEDRSFWIGIGAGLVLTLGALFLEGAWRYVCLLAIPGYSFSGLVALRFIDSLAMNSSANTRADFFAAKEKKVRDEFEPIFAMVDAAFDAAGATTAEDFATVMAQRATLQQELATSEVEYADFLADPEHANVEGRIDGIRVQQEELHGQISSLAEGYVRDPREIDRDIELIEQNIEEARRADAEASIPPPPEPEKYADPFPSVLKCASEVLAAELPATWDMLRDRCTQYFGALTDKRYAALDVSPDGRAVAISGAGRISAADLPALDLDLLYLSIRLTAIERLVATHRCVLVCEDPFARFRTDPKLPLLQRMLRHMGTLTQVLYVSPSGYVAAQGETVGQI